MPVGGGRVGRSGCRGVIGRCGRPRVYAGLRRGELQALDWSHIDLEAGVIHVQRSWDGTCGPDRTEEQGRQPERADRGRAPRSPAQPPPPPRPRRAGLRLHQPEWPPIQLHSARLTRAKRAWSAAGLEPVGLHDCRHTYAAFMIAAGINTKALCTYMGHSTIAVTSGATTVSSPVTNWKPPDSSTNGSPTPIEASGRADSLTAERRRPVPQPIFKTVELVLHSGQAALCCGLVGSFLAVGWRVVLLLGTVAVFGRFGRLRRLFWDAAESHSDRTLVAGAWHTTALPASSRVNSVRNDDPDCCYRTTRWPRGRLGTTACRSQRLPADVASEPLSSAFTPRSPRFIAHRWFHRKSGFKIGLSCSTRASRLAGKIEHRVVRRRRSRTSSCRPDALPPW